MIALNFDAAFRNGAARATFPFEFCGKRLQLLGWQSQSRDHGHAFSFSTLRFAAHTHDTIAR